MLIEDIYKVNELINSKDKDNNFNRIYNFSNENLYGYMNNIDFKDKKVLTCGSSCDQLFNIIYSGGRDITLFDINPFVKYYFDLKYALIKNVSMKEYLYFITNRMGLNIIDMNIYNRIRKDMPLESRAFWDYLFKDNKFINVKKKLFALNNNQDRREIILNNNYLRNYDNNKLINMIDDSRINFINMDIRNIYKLTNKYDYIFLSNIIDYMYGTDIIKLLENMDNVLNDNGIIYLNYVWLYHSVSYMYEFEEMMKDVKGFNKELFMNSEHFDDDEDCVYTYKKIKELK